MAIVRPEFGGRALPYSSSRQDSSVAGDSGGNGGGDGGGGGGGDGGDRGGTGGGGSGSRVLTTIPADFTLAKPVTALAATLSKYQAGVKERNRIDQFLRKKKVENTTGAGAAGAGAGAVANPVGRGDGSSLHGAATVAFKRRRPKREPGPSDPQTKPPRVKSPSSTTTTLKRVSFARQRAGRLESMFAQCNDTSNRASKKRVTSAEDGASRGADSLPCHDPPLMATQAGANNDVAVVVRGDKSRHADVEAEAEWSSLPLQQQQQLPAQSVAAQHNRGARAAVSGSARPLGHRKVITQWLKRPRHQPRAGHGISAFLRPNVAASSSGSSSSSSSSSSRSGGSGSSSNDNFATPAPPVQTDRNTALNFGRGEDGDGAMVVTDLTSSPLDDPVVAATPASPSFTTTAQDSRRRAAVEGTASSGRRRRPGVASAAATTTKTTTTMRVVRSNQRTHSSHLHHANNASTALKWKDVDSAVFLQLPKRIQAEIRRAMAASGR